MNKKKWDVSLAPSEKLDVGSKEKEQMLNSYNQQCY
jgi:hypothetical protein